jgi:hypothetical protein
MQSKLDWVPEGGHSPTTATGRPDLLVKLPQKESMANIRKLGNFTAAHSSVAKLATTKFIATHEYSTVPAGQTHTESEAISALKCLKR